MKKSLLLAIALAILILFTIQTAGTLVESIYILDLMTSGLDAKVLGVLFFFAPLLMLPLVKRFPRQMVWALAGLLLVARGITPYLDTATRLVTSGLATAACFSLLIMLISYRLVDGQSAGAGLALAVGLSALLRTAGHGIELSLTSSGGWIGWVLGVLLLGSLAFSSLKFEPAAASSGGNQTGPVFGIYLILTLVYFSVSAPAVIARWTETNYTLIVVAISLLSAGWAWLSINRPGWLQRISTTWLVAWNLVFTASLTLTLVAQRVAFPRTLASEPVVVGAPSTLQILPLVVFLLTFPVLFLDFEIFIGRLYDASQPAGSLVPGILLGGFVLILLVFVNIFSNVWGYVKPISPIFRNTFWLAYFILSALISLVGWRVSAGRPIPSQAPPSGYSWPWSALISLVFLGTLVFALPRPHVQADATAKTSLRLMTMNTQQSNDAHAQKSFAAQLALIQQVSPDILALQETDSTRISLNNNDYVRYFADHLGYYSYYGPRTPTGTYGTAILSKFPLLYTVTVFMYSDKDETGVAVADVQVSGLSFTIYDVHPDSSDPAMVAFARQLIALSDGQTNVIAMGDYNLRDYEPAYKMLDSVFTNAWTSVYPSEVSPDGVDMSGDNRIDHIFLSPNLSARNPTYILPPASATDHPVHWTDILWSTP